LIDACSMVYVLKARRPEILIGNYIQELTPYEVLNAIWKEACLIQSISPEKAGNLVKVLTEVFSLMNILSIRSLEPEIFEKAVELETTVYDASYIVLAKKNELVLVTEDRRLQEKATSIVKVTSVKDLLSE